MQLVSFHTSDTPFKSTRESRYSAPFLLISRAYEKLRKTSAYSLPLSSGTFRSSFGARRDGPPRFHVLLAGVMPGSRGSCTSTTQHFTKHTDKLDQDGVPSTLLPYDRSLAYRALLLFFTATTHASGNRAKKRPCVPRTRCYFGVDKDGEVGPKDDFCPSRLRRKARFTCFPLNRVAWLFISHLSSRIDPRAYFL